MRAVFGILSLVVVMAVVLLLAKQQTRQLVPQGPAQAASAPVPAPQALGQQVQGLLEQGAQRASEAMP